MKGNLLSKKDFLIISEKTRALLANFLGHPELHGHGRFNTVQPS